MDLRIVGFTVGILLFILGGAMLVPADVDFLNGNPNAHIFLECGLLTMFVGTLLCIVNLNFRHEMTVRQSFLLTVACWTVISLFSALPLYLSDLQLSFTDAAFEAISGITTTGSTVLSGLDHMSHGILLWRAITQWIGGIGIIAFAIVLLPFLHIGGMQLFQAESSDRSDKIMGRAAHIVKAVVFVYIGLTVLCAVVFYELGMTGFDAITHALTTMPTGGYSTHDASFGFFNAELQWACAGFMFLGGLPFVLYARALVQRRFDFWADDQVRGTVWLLAGVIGALTTWLVLSKGIGLSEGLRYVTFNVISVITTTGFATTDYTTWGSFAVGAFFFLTYLGACAGSTSGGVKMMRLRVTAAALNREMKNLIHPSGMFQATYQDKPVNDDIVRSVLTFLFIFVAGNVMLTAGLALCGLDFATTVSAAATATANVGPGIGDIIGPSGNFSTLPDAAKWQLSAGMLFGRLEFMTAIVLFLPNFWKD